MKSSTTRHGTGKPANGAGWGGAAKGAGSRKTRKDLGGAPGPGRGNFTIAGEERREALDRRTATLMAHLWHLSLNADTQAAQIQATVHLLNRLQGLPVQTVLSSVRDDLAGMSDEELASSLERDGRKLRAFQERVVGANLPKEPDRLGD